MSHRPTLVARAPCAIIAGTTRTLCTGLYPVQRPSKRRCREGFVQETTTVNSVLSRQVSGDAVVAQNSNNRTLPAAPSSNLCNAEQSEIVNHRTANDIVNSNASSQSDSVESAQTICAGILKAAVHIQTTGLLPWRSNLEALKPEGITLQALDAALQSYGNQTSGTWEQLDRACEVYDATLQYRAAMTWLIRCFLEVARRSSCRRVRKGNYVSTKIQDDRRLRLRLGELMLAVTGTVYERHGSRAYKLCALLAGKYSASLSVNSHSRLIASCGDFKPHARRWRIISKDGVTQLASCIAKILSSPEYDHVWQGVDSSFELDPAQVVTTSDLT